MTRMAPSGGASALEARDLTFGYTPGRPVLDRWSAQFPHGAMTAVTGPSGRGKSTLLYLLGLMLRPTGGDVLVGGRPYSGAQDAVRARLRSRAFGFVFQDSALDPSRSVLDNVTETALYRGVGRRSVEPAARDLLARLGVDVSPDRKPGQVSGGQAQRIALCRALLNAPSILLADEPTGNLDPATTGVVVDALRRHAEAGATVVIVTHSREVAAACDREIGL